jgi:hypothetical protein
MFIRVIQGHATNPPGIYRELGRWHRMLAADADGWLGSTAGITDDGWSITVVRFASEAQARRNSDRPEQRDWWRVASRHLAPVVVHDASEVHSFRQGDADQAGFVQVIQGRGGDLEGMVGVGRDQREALAREAPHILGMTVAKHADRAGDFTQILYFSSEQDAREERRPLRSDLRCFDLRDPRLLSPAIAYTY